MHFVPAITFLAAIGTVIAVPTGGSESQCTTDQANKCCTSLTNGILNINILPALCVPLLDTCNNQAACCESNGIGLLNCLTVQI
ncbi:hypothetical protein PENANT_c002G05806 [Penicillium antarcticum]|uniref:Hydrophobin n=1 Tax=Penicillium antarcticum TaxID=416450 RepID=A0A1V6QM03_9EURO|nr:uncharacterized protein N7508_006753 [Penicillium antarcticum]KAJ5301890.1 hypothetical protein N7508_006753 [Penicillium antarcticum]OQD89982.1 hypothetical protein PENANT_c002G05806 [Penicillium antarcticum]